jgi:uncharacterized membrane protein (UPF0127 family)
MQKRARFHTGFCAAVWFAVATAAGCSKPAPVANAVPPLPQESTVVFYPATGGAPWAVSVEVAKTDETRARGLMYRRELPQNTGMLFLFDVEELRRFWMRNTYIPLDMVFLNARKVVVGVEENTIPHDQTSRGPDQLAQYVVEVAGGEARKHGVTIGARAEFLHVEGSKQ